MCSLSRLCVNEDWCEGTLCKIQRRAIRVICLQKSRKVVPSFGIGSGGQYTVAAAARSNPPHVALPLPGLHLTWATLMAE